MRKMNGESRYTPIILTAVISSLVSAVLMFLAVWFTTVSGLQAKISAEGDLYRQDRQFIFDSLSRAERSIGVLQTDRFTTGIQMAELRFELGEIRRVLARIEARRAVE